MIFNIEYDGDAIYIWDRWYENMLPIIKPEGDLDFYSIRFKMVERKEEFSELGFKTFLELLIIEMEGERPK